MVEKSTTTIAFIGGEHRRLTACIMSLPKRCNRIRVGDQKLVLVGRWSKRGLCGADEKGQEVSSSLDLRPEIKEIVGKPEILMTRERYVFCNLDLLNSDKLASKSLYYPYELRKLLRWVGCFPDILYKKHPQLFKPPGKNPTLGNTISLN